MSSFGMMLVLTAVASPGGPPSTRSLRVASGFTIEKVAGEPNVLFPMFATLDDRGRLFVAESSGGDLYKEASEGTHELEVRARAGWEML